MKCTVTSPRGVKIQATLKKEESARIVRHDKDTEKNKIECYLCKHL